MNKIVVIGGSNVDFVIDLPHLPREGETVLARGVQFCYGGKGANQASAIARLGGDVSLISCLGGDEHAPALVSRLRENGVNISGVEIASHVPTGAAYINVGDAGENSVVVNPGANNFISAELVTRRCKLFEGASYCVIQLEIPLPTIYHVANVCRERGIRLVIDASPIARLDLEKLRGTWMIIPNERELHSLIPGLSDTQTKAEMLKDKGFENVLVTLGERGCLVQNSEGSAMHSAYHGLPVVDKTAVGDSFIGALVFALAKNMDLSKAISMASRASAIAISRRGTLTSMPTWAEVLQIM